MLRLTLILASLIALLLTVVSAALLSPHPAEMARLRLEDSAVRWVAFARDGSLLAYPWLNRVRVWDIAAGTQRFELALDRPAYNAIFSPDDRQLVTMDSGQTRLWDASSGALLHSLPRDGLPASSIYVFFSPGGTYLSGVGSTGRASVWDAATGREVMTLRDTVDGLPLRFNPSETRLLTGSTSGAIALWAVPSGDLIPLPPLPGTMVDALFETDDTVLATTHTGLFRWRPGADEWMRLDGGGGGYFMLRTADGHLLTYDGPTSMTTLWDVGRGQVIEQLAPYYLQAPALTADDSILLIGREQIGVGDAALLDLTAGQVRYTIAGGVRHFSPGGRWLISHSSIYAREHHTFGADLYVLPPKIWLWDVARRSRVALARGDQAVTVYFSPDGDRLVVYDVTGIGTTELRVLELAR